MCVSPAMCFTQVMALASETFVANVNGESSYVSSTTSTVKAETKMSADRGKTVSAEVSQTTANRIIEKAIENKSEEIVVSIANANITETAAGTTTEVSPPASSVNEISEKQRCNHNRI